MNSKNYGKIFFISILLILSIVRVFPDLVIADDHKTNKRHYKQYKNNREHHDDDNHKRRRLKKDDEGNETTGQTAAWLLAAANLTIALSILIKGGSRFLPLDSQIKNSIKKFNQLQKKHLMRFHYVLNPIALCVAFFHYLLSSCRSSPLPEWGLILVTLMVFLGLILKFRCLPRGCGNSFIAYILRRQLF